MNECISARLSSQSNIDFYGWRLLNHVRSANDFLRRSQYSTVASVVQNHRKPKPEINSVALNLCRRTPSPTRCSLRKDQLQVPKTTKPYRRMLDAIFCFICALHGVRSGFPMIRRMSLLAWGLSVASYPFTVGPEIDSKVKARPSFSELTSAFTALIHVFSTVDLLHTLVVKLHAHKRLLRGHVRCFKDVALPLFCSFPLTCMLIIGTIEEGGTSAFADVVFGSCNFSGMTFFIIYADAVSDLLRQMETLDESCELERISMRGIISEKWRIREEIQTINSRYSNQKAWQHLQLFSGTVFVLSSTVDSLPQVLFLICALLAKITNIDYATTKAS